MAISRLRHLVLSRGPSVAFRIRHFTTRRSLSRLLNAQNYFPEFIANNNNNHRSFTLKLQMGVRYFSATETPSHTVLEMPALSPTMNQGNIAKWKKKEGDKIEEGDVLCEIETDKATVEFESLEEGFLAKILAPEGSKDVLVGQPIAITVEDPDDIKKIPSTISGGSEVKVEKPKDVDKVDRAHKISFSRISPSAKLLITEFGLDASSLEVTGPRGTLLKGDVLAALKSGKASSRTSHSSKVEKPASPQTLPQSSLESSSESRSHLHDADSHEDHPNSQIRKAGYWSAVIARRLLESKQNTPHLYLSSDVILDPLLSFRKELKEKHNIKVSVNDIVIKAVAVALKNVPEANAYWNVDKGETVLCDSVDISIAVATEKGLMTPIVRNADQKSISAISSEKLVSTEQVDRVEEDFLANTILLHTEGHIAFGREVCRRVGVLGFVPSASLKDLMGGDEADRDKRIWVKELAEKARAGKLSPNEFEGGTFSISNLGMFPVDQFCAIINPPQACILAVGRGNKIVEPVVGSDGMEKPGVVTKMNLTLSADHRVFDGKVGGSFVSALRMNFSDIRRLLL
ncbi:hypothetical protein IFM89_015242 [Coptis chinensis]|uniref:Dihydrolipoamide acetyltransferase component of pyruvate dehydrogenase complex n=1 Tax=Coptis chinensis TaxID=261450 RepID=A0A835HD62_9MAGN|nr:hypothetical protein IFM89_015242 [Coptis chinensis]